MSKIEKKKYSSLRNDSKRILAQGEYVSNDTFETGNNNNDLIIGPTGAGKTRYYVKPNLLSASESLVVTDTKGNLCKELGPALRDAGYEILHLNLADPRNSIGYNPFDYIPYDEATDKYDEKEIMAFSNILYGEKGHCKDPYWDEAGRALLTSIVSYVMEKLPKEDHNIYSVRKLFTLIRANGKQGDKSPYYNLMNALRETNPDSFAAEQYDYVITESVETTSNCIRMMTGNRLSLLRAKEIDELLRREDRIDILQLAQKKTALFVTISDMDRSQDMLANLFYTQAMQTLCRYADKECEDSCLPVPVRFILDDFATNACIPDFDNMISVIRSRGISVSIILQSLTQLEKMYGKAAATTILNGCDTVLYLGGQDLSTAHYIGTRVNHSDFSVLTLPLSQAWLLQRGQKPRLVRRYELADHPRYSFLPEAGAENAITAKTAREGGDFYENEVC